MVNNVMLVPNKLQCLSRPREGSILKEIHATASDWQIDWVHLVSTEEVCLSEYVYFEKYNKGVSRHINNSFQICCYFLLFLGMKYWQLSPSEDANYASNETIWKGKTTFWLNSQLNVHISYLWWLQQQDRTLFWRVTIQKGWKP